MCKVTGRVEGWREVNWSKKTTAGLWLNWEQVDRNWAFLSWNRGEISLQFRDQNCLKTFLTKKNNKSFEMENLSLCCSLSDVLWVCGAALTRCRMSPSIQCFQPLLFFSPFWTQTSLSPSQVTRDCTNQIINSVTLTRTLWAYKNQFKQREYTITVASYHSPISSLKNSQSI